MSLRTIAGTSETNPRAARDHAGRIEALEGDDGRPEHRAAQVDEQATDVGGREARHPRVVRPSSEPFRGRLDRRLDRIPRQLHQLRLALGPGRGDHDRGPPAQPAGIPEQRGLTGRVQHRGRAGPIHQRPALPIGEPLVEREERDLLVPQLLGEVYPRRPRGQIDREQLPRPDPVPLRNTHVG
ncbi:MAG: hypothetical protein U0V56_04035 [Actinomycetota bacterium]